MRRPLLVCLAVAGLLAACAVENGSDDGTAKSVAPAEPPTVANTRAPEVPAAYAAMNENLPARGDTLPAFVGTTLDGEQAGLSSIEGKTALINLWFYG